MVGPPGHRSLACARRAAGDGDVVGEGQRLNSDDLARLVDAEDVHLRREAAR